MTSIGTHYLVGLDLLGPLLEVGLQKPDERRNVAGPLPEDGRQQVWEELHVGLGHRVVVQLEQQRQDLEHVGDELCNETHTQGCMIINNNKNIYLCKHTKPSDYSTLIPFGYIKSAILRKILLRPQLKKM